MSAPSAWDYYEATLTSIFDPQNVILGLNGAGLAAAGPAHRNYPASFAWELATGGSVQVWYGSGLEVHVVLSSGACDDLVSVVRRMWPHRVSRADVAKDYDYLGAFEALYKPLDALAQPQRPNKVQTSTAGDWLHAEKGRTLYLGAFSSRWLGRIYEKGLEQSAKHPDQTFSPNWVRVEAQVRPRTAAHKLALSTMTPDQVFASTTFGAAVLAHLGGMELTPLALQRVPSTDPLYWLVQQYGRTLQTIVDAEPTVTVAALLARVRSRSLVS